MDIQDHGKNHSSVHESQVYICRKCGWPFPKPHPSAKHRRSHKKICGTIEGYKLIDATASDEEQVSDEYHKTPSAQVPKVMESCNLEKSIGGIGAMSNRSEDEVFSDAAMEFQDGGFGLGRQDSLVRATKSDKDLTPTISFKDCEDTCDVIPIGKETVPGMDFFVEGRKIGGGDKAAESSVTVRQENDGGFILSSEHPGEISETTSKSGHAEQESDGRGNPEINLERNLMDVVALNSEPSCVTSEETDDTTSETRLANKIVEVKENDEKLALDTVVNDLSGKAESAKDIEASTYTFQIPTDVIQLDEGSDTLGKTFIMLPDAAEVVKVSDTSFDSNEVFLKTEKESASVYALSVREDIPVVENADIELEDFKDHNTVKLPRVEAVASREIIVDEEKSIENIVKDELVQGKVDVIQNTLDSSVDADADAAENEKGQEVCSFEEKQPIYVCDDLHKTGFSGAMVNVLPNVNPSVSHAESARTEVFDIAEDENTRRSEKEYYVKDSLTSNESTNDSSLSQTNPASNKLEVENSTFEPVSPHHQSTVVTKECNNNYMRVPETEDQHSNRVLNSLDDIKEPEISSDNKVQQECAGEDLRTPAADNIEGNEFEKISRDQLKKESIHSPSYPEPTGQNSDSFDDSHTRESGVDASRTSFVNLPGDADNHYIQPQPDAAIGDGQCGSVSVLSTRSDNVALINTGISPATISHPILEPEKANFKEPSVASEQIFDKSDELEPPSFSTLIEPGGKDQTAPAPEIQNTQNPGAAPLQAGWFPSLTQATNESEGRKKNEEMIEKVTNWNAKQHIPLKSLLGEATNETRPKSPIEPSRDEKVVANDEKGVMVRKVSSILGPESPANNEADVIGVKRKGKGRPLWVQFVCCSSVN